MSLPALVGVLFAVAALLYVLAPLLWPPAFGVVSGPQVGGVPVHARIWNTSKPSPPAYLGSSPGFGGSLCRVSVQTL